MTPPATATQTDDGYLSSSEISGLKLDADWVVLSAGNTAGGEASSSEVFSGLARAFFYAGTRALLVSHWPVSSEAAVAITTGATSAMTSHPDIGGAEALRRSISALIAKGGENGHPSVWAPFVLVGTAAHSAPFHRCCRSLADVWANRCPRRIKKLTCLGRPQLADIVAKVFLSHR